MKRSFVYSAVFFLLASAAGAYEKIEFKNLIANPAMQKPAAVAAAKGKVFVSDLKANAVFVFDAEGKLLKKIEGGLKSPEAIAFGGGRLYVADTGNSRIVVFDAEGKLLWAFSSDGSAPGQLDGPKGIAYGPDGRLYVSNTGNSRVDVFNADGIYLYGFPAMKQDGVTKLNPAKISLSRSGDVLVSDPDKAVVHKYDRTGKLLKEIQAANNGAITDARGLIYLISTKEGRVREYSEAGEPIATFGTKGKGKMEFKSLRDLAADEAGILYFSDDENKKVVAINVESGETGPELPQAVLLDRFMVAGPVERQAVKADVFTVTYDGKIIAWLPEAKELALFDKGVKKTLVKEGKQQGQVRAPRGLTVDKKGLIYVADTGNDRVQIFNPDGTFNNQFGESGSSDGQFRQPSSVAVNAKGNIYVADTKNKKIKAFSPDGMFLFAAGPEMGNVVLANPVAVRCDDAKGVYILDSALKKVIVMDSMGKFQRIWDDSGRLQDPASLAYDGKGFFYILDKGANNVKIFDEAGNFTASFFAKGKGERELWAPQYLAFRNDKVYISDLESSRLLGFDISYLPAEPTELKADASGKDGVALAWNAKANAWSGGFKVYRTKGADGELKEVGAPKEKAFSDKLSEEATYYYYVAGLSVSGAQGGLSLPAAYYYKPPEEVRTAAAGEPGGSKNVAPMEIVPVALNYIFSSNYKYYMKNPIGKIAIRNNTDSAFSNLKVSMELKDFMDYPTDTPVAEVKPMETVEVDLMATLNNKILTINEDTPIQCHLVLTYYQDGAEKTFTLNQPIKVLSKNAIVWDDSARLANFITANDTPIKTLKSAILTGKEKYMDKADFLNDTVVQALMVWEGLGELGINYQADPANPFQAKKSTAEAEMPLDTVQFPRQTIKLKSGDCDDLTALYATMFQAAGVPSAILDYPGHIALMIDTGEGDAKNVGIPEEYLIKYNNTWWVGIETTMTGKDFYDGVKHEADMYKRMASEVKVVDVAAALRKFEPVTLPETEYEAKLDPAVFGKRVTDAIEALRTTRYDYFKNYYGQILLNTPDDAEANMNLGILEAQYDKDASAAEYFDKVLAKDPSNAAAFNNLGNLAFRKGKYDEAKEYYFKATKADPFDGNVWLNLARASARQGKKDDVRMFAEKAAKIDPAAKAIGDKLIK
jgi:DNA-binding beta-propeller fold protein YncE/tetratricopeptide (TPR) repeat protein